MGIQTKYGVLRMKRSIGGTFPTFNEANSPWHTETDDVSGNKALVGISALGNIESSSEQFVQEVPFGYLDSPNTTSAVKYRLNMLIEKDSGSTVGVVNGNVYMNNDYGSHSGTSYMVVMEVKG